MGDGRHNAPTLLPTTGDAYGQTYPDPITHSHLLREGREPEYFGATVGPGDSDTVLMRWNLDDGHCRVIYGDLRAETVPAATQINDSP